MPSKISETIQTIVALKELRQRDAAQKLAEQMGLNTRQATQVSMLGQLQNIFQGAPQQGAMTGLAPLMGQATGIDPQLLAGVSQNTAPAPQAVLGGAAGAGNAGGQMNVKAASEYLTGGKFGDPQHELMNAIFGGAQQHFANMPEEERNPFLQGVVQKLGTGQDLTQAAIDQAVVHLSPEDRARAAKIGAGLLPSSSTEEQLRLGYANMRVQDRQVTAMSAYQTMEAKAQLVAAQGKIGGQAFQEANDILNKRQELLFRMGQTSATLTDAGRTAMIEQLNAYNNQLRATAPQVFGPKGTAPLSDMGTDKSVGPTGPFNAFWQAVKQK